MTRLLLATLLLPAALSAQALGLGRWPGRLILPGDDTLAVRVDASRPKDRLLLDVTAASGVNWSMGSVKEKPRRLEFTWALDSPRPMLCTLSHRSDVRWEGYCDDTARGADGKFLRLFVVLERFAGEAPR
jgi:hypothetical protein